VSELERTIQEQGWLYDQHRGRAPYVLCCNDDEEEEGGILFYQL